MLPVKPTDLSRRPAAGETLMPEWAVVGCEAEDAPHSIERMAGSVRSSDTPDRVEAGQDVLPCDEGSGSIEGAPVQLPFVSSATTLIAE
jgi:hypothetical protein